ncbi:acid protease [Dendrothele bispora CBS 962.96]|uniref:Acid protease n=1 Tax=Dendrothele bispora (strain CBS 962.96) TaxID=1314807 RepID=A0A4S8M5F3_DENBC|nr:acid protease [Dendrothele bispora CBS 962.96]
MSPPTAKATAVMTRSILISLQLAILFLSHTVTAAPAPQPKDQHVQARAASTGGGLTIPLMRRNTRPTQLSEEEWGLWAKNNKAGLINKYGASTKSSKKKRASGTNSIVNQGADSSFFGTLSIGNPPTSYNVILDTGSSDLWIAGSGCRSCDANTPTFSSSSSTKQVGSPFSITYGSGEAAGELVSDTVSMAGFAVTNQVFALAFETISSSGATPWWQNLAQSNSWDEPLMAFQLTRFGAGPSAHSEEIGGSFNLGFTNQTLYKGYIDFRMVQLPVTSGPSTYAAIDTGTKLIGGPEDVIQGIYAQVPGSRALTGNSEGYYAFPCDQDVQISMDIGSSSNMWTISPDDYKAYQSLQTMCVGAFFALDLGGGSESGGNGGTEGVPNWIVGDSFLVPPTSVSVSSFPPIPSSAVSRSAFASVSLDASLIE